VLRRRPVDRPHLHRHPHAARETARPARVSSAPALTGGAYDPKPSRPSGVRLAKVAAVPRGAAPPLSRRHGFQNGVHALPDRAGPSGGRLLHFVQPGAGAGRAEKRTLSDPAAASANASAAACPGAPSSRRASVICTRSRLTIRRQTPAG